jgi:hypothetical protein
MVLRLYDYPVLRHLGHYVPTGRHGTN